MTGARLPTASQTVGPYFALGMHWPESAVLVNDTFQGRAVRVTGCIFDGAGDAVPDALLEIWQADTRGRYDHRVDRRNEPFETGFRGAGRAGVDGEGKFAFTTLKPGPIDEPDGWTQAPHIGLVIFARGLLAHLHTRMYFADEPAANASDRVLSFVAPERRSTLMAARTNDGYHIDIHLQGERETVFFDF